LLFTRHSSLITAFQDFLHTVQNDLGHAGIAFERLADAARHARAAGLAVHAGHGLNYVNVAAVTRLREVEELNIGHSIVSRAIFVGMERAVAEMRAVVDAARVDQPSAEP